MIPRNGQGIMPESPITAIARRKRRALSGLPDFIAVQQQIARQRPFRRQMSADPKPHEILVRPALRASPASTGLLATIFKPPEPTSG